MGRPRDYRSETEITAHSIILRTLDLLGLVPDRAQLDPQALADNPPRLYRIQQLLAVLDAFGLTLASRPLHPEGLETLRRTTRSTRGGDGSEIRETGLEHVQRLRPIEFFLEGYFVFQRPLHEYRGLLRFLRPYWPPSWPDDTEVVEGVPEYAFTHVQRLWTRVLDFRRAAEQVIDFNGGVLEASGWYFCGINLTESVGRALGEQLGEIDTVLSSLLDPERRVLPRTELVRRHGFPDVDLLDVDADWA
jgi:hypothetical protein